MEISKELRGKIVDRMRHLETYDDESCTPPEEVNNLFDANGGFVEWLDVMLKTCSESTLGMLEDELQQSPSSTDIHDTVYLLRTKLLAIRDHGFAKQNDDSRRVKTDADQALALLDYLRYFHYERGHFGDNAEKRLQEIQNFYLQPRMKDGMPSGVIFATPAVRRDVAFLLDTIKDMQQQIQKQ